MCADPLFKAPKTESVCDQASRGIAMAGIPGLIQVANSIDPKVRDKIIQIWNALPDKNRLWMTLKEFKLDPERIKKHFL
jgi:hypothetical protein